MANERKRSATPMFQVVLLIEGKPMEGIRADTPAHAAEIYAERHGLHFGTMVEVYDWRKDRWVGYQVRDHGQVLWCGQTRETADA